MFQNNDLSEYRLKGAKYIEKLVHFWLGTNYMREIGSLPDCTKNETVTSFVSAI